MKVFIRCDASQEIGSGHVMRCLTLADALKDFGYDIDFLTSPGTVQMIPRLAQGDYPCRDEKQTPESCDLLIVDHYDLDAAYETPARKWAAHVMVIDDLANRNHDCDVLLDQTFGRLAGDYTSLVPDHCQILTGTDYALLRPEFARLRSEAEKRRQSRAGKIERLLVSLGQTNVGNITGQVLHALRNFTDQSMQIDVVLGCQAQNLDDIRTQIEDLNRDTDHKVTLYLDVDNMADLMLVADLAIGAGGTTSWERCGLGLPTIAVKLADNQSEILENLQQAGAILYLTDDHDHLPTTLPQVLRDFVNDPAKPQSLALNSLTLCDCLGVQKVSQTLKEMLAT